MDMNDSLKLTTQQKLQQRLTPMQVQFVRMLEMSAPEIEEEVTRAVDEMPALEIADSSHDDNDPVSDGEFNETAEEMMLADYRTDDDIPSYRLEASNHSPDDTYREPVTVSTGETLIETLTSQLAEHDLTPEQAVVADYIIGNLDDNGYLTRDINAIAGDVAINQGIEVTMQQVRETWDIVRRLDPAGVGAVDLRDCLLLQLRRRRHSEAVDDAIEIIAHYFDLFSKKHYERISSATGISPARLKEAVATIRQLNPKPGSMLSSGSVEDTSRHIIPDFNVDTDGDKITLTLLNNIPELRIEQTFSSDTPIPGATERERNNAATFIRQKRDEAANFIRILRLRQETLYRVMSAIVKLQRDFFLTDDESLIKPMILKDIAAMTGYDLSVISRATAAKYVLTRHGVYPLKMFFNERPKVDTDTSSHEIIASIREIIAAEDKNHPLSDETITGMLHDKGFDIARRTVAKYREKSGFPVARLRKELQ